MVAPLVALLLMASPAVGTIREQKPFTVTVGLGYPELIHADVSYTFVDRITASLGAGASLGGAALRIAGLWHVLASENHGHSLFLGPALTVFPPGPFFGSNRLVLIPLAMVGWEWRALFGLTLRVSGGGGADVNVGVGTSPTFAVRADLGWSF